MQTGSWIMSVLVIAAILMGIGWYLDTKAFVTQPTLFWPFMFASAIGCWCALIWANARIRHVGAKILLALIVIFVWRVAYFPVLVFSGFLASLGEMFWRQLAPDRAAIYPFFLMALFLQYMVIVWFLSALFRSRQPNWTLADHVDDDADSTADSDDEDEDDDDVINSESKRASGSRGALAHSDRINDGKGIANWLILPPRWLVIAVGLPLIVTASLVSFTKPVDLTLLPDEPWAKTPELPAAELPRENPYLQRLGKPSYNIAQQVLFFNAGMTYDLVPNTPWAARVKGTLETLVNDHPQASSRERVRDHYLAYLAAHSYIRPDEKNNASKTGTNE